MWVKAESQPPTNSNYALVDKEDGVATQYLFDYTDVAGVNKLRFCTFSGDNCKSGDFSLTTGTWTHVAVTYDDTANEVKFYKNGVQEGATITYAGSISDTAAPFFVGNYNNGGTPSNFWDGLIDEVRIWSVVRTQTEINTNKSTEIDSAANLQASWHLNNALTDSSGNGNTLTNNNAAVFSTDVPFTGTVVSLPNRSLLGVGS